MRRSGGRGQEKNQETQEEKETQQDGESKSASHASLNRSVTPIRLRRLAQGDWFMPKKKKKLKKSKKLSKTTTLSHEVTPLKV
jgi:hypothetical protein